MKEKEKEVELPAAVELAQAAIEEDFNANMVELTFA